MVTEVLCEKRSLNDDFLEFADKMTRLEGESPEFQSIERQYYELDDKIQRLEARGVPTSDEHFENMKKERLLVKDRIYHILSH
ncbi:MAG: YdcH family protein [Endozoicomonas sp.]